MIVTDEEYRRSREYVDGVVSVLLSARHTVPPEQYRLMSISFAGGIVKAQREMAEYLATSAGVGQAGEEAP